METNRKPCSVRHMEMIMSCNVLGNFLLVLIRISPLLGIIQDAQAMLRRDAGALPK